MLRLDEGTTAKELACGVYDTDVINPVDELAGAGEKEDKVNKESQESHRHSQQPTYRSTLILIQVTRYSRCGQCQYITHTTNGRTGLIVKRTTCLQK